MTTGSNLARKGVAHWVYLVVVVLLATSLYYWWPADKEPGIPGSTLVNPSQTPRGGSSAKATLPSASSPPASSASGANAQTKSQMVPRTARLTPSLEKVRTSKDWKKLFDELDATADLPLADRLFAKAFILNACVVKSTMPAGYPLPPVDIDPAVLARHYTDPQQRAAVLEWLSRDVRRVCAGFGNVTITRREIADAYTRAAEAGDVRARAWLVGNAMTESGLRNAQYAASDSQSNSAFPERGFADKLTQEQKETLIAALTSKDPVAVHLAGPLLTHSTEAYSVRLGPTDIDFSARIAETWTVVACEFGFECGPSNAEMLGACTNEKLCSTDYVTWLRDHRLTGAEFDMVMQSAQILVQAITTGDWSQVKFVDQGGRVNYIDKAPPRPRFR